MSVVLCPSTAGRDLCGQRSAVFCLVEVGRGGVWSDEGQGSRVVGRRTWEDGRRQVNWIQQTGSRQCPRFDQRIRRAAPGLGCAALGWFGWVPCDGFRFGLGCVVSCRVVLVGREKERKGMVDVVVTPRRSVLLLVVEIFDGKIGRGRTVLVKVGFGSAFQLGASSGARH